MKIWIPKFKIVEPKKELSPRATVAGRFKLEAVKPDGRRRILADWFPNIITDAGLNRIGGNADWLSTCMVGTGNAAPTAADTTLAARVASTTVEEENNFSILGEPPYYSSRTKTFRFSQGAAEGNLAEVGIGWSTTAVFSRALILDGEGSPTTIAVQADEFLDVTYEFRLYPPLVDVEDTITIAEVQHDVTVRASNVTKALCWGINNNGSSAAVTRHATAYTGSIGAITEAPTGSSGDSASASSEAYTDSSLLRDFSCTFGLTAANLGGIRSIRFGNSDGFARGSFDSYQAEFDPVITKDNTKVLSLMFRHSWSRGSI